MRTDLQNAIDAAKEVTAGKRPTFEWIEEKLSSGEEIIQLMYCGILKSDTKLGYAVLSNQYLHLFRAGALLGSKSAEHDALAFKHITSIEQQNVPLFKTKNVKIVQSSGATIVLANCDANESEQFVTRVRELMANGGDSKTIQTDPLDQLKKLKELLDAGILSQAEFDDKKQSLMDKIQGVELENMSPVVDTSLTGAAGEHLVLSRLLSKGYLAAQAPRGVRKVDILVNFIDGGEPFLIQVKARQRGGDGGWHMGEKHESQTDEDLFYCFVDFEPASPTVHVIPATVVAETLKTDHQIWLDTPGKNGQAHNPTTFRRLRPKPNGKELGWMDDYLENWEQLDRATKD